MELSSKFKTIIRLLILIVIVLFLPMAIFFNKKHLYLYDDVANHMIGKYSFDEDNTFSISYIHSVNKSPVIDFYTYDNFNSIINIKTIYYNFGAGVETTLEGNEKLHFGANGEMIVDNINKKIDSLIYIVGTVYDHTLTINGKKYILNKIYGKNKHIKFIVK